MIFSFPLRLLYIHCFTLFSVACIFLCISSFLFCSQPSSGVTSKTCSQCLPNHYGSLSQGCSREYPAHSGRCYETLSLPTSINYKGQSGGQSHSNVCYWSFMVPRKGHITTRVMRVLLDMPTVLMKAVSDVCSWAEKLSCNTNNLRLLLEHPVSH